MSACHRKKFGIVSWNIEKSHLFQPIKLYFLSILLTSSANIFAQIFSFNSSFKRIFRSLSATLKNIFSYNFQYLTLKYFSILLCQHIIISGNWVILLCIVLLWCVLCCVLRCMLCCVLCYMLHCMLYCVMCCMLCCVLYCVVVCYVVVVLPHMAELLSAAACLCFSICFSSMTTICFCFCRQASRAAANVTISRRIFSICDRFCCSSLECSTWYKNNGQ